MLLNLLAIVGVYIALVYAASDQRSEFGRAVVSDIRAPWWMAVALALAIAVTVDGIIFHTGLYERFLEPNSAAGKIALRVTAERERPPNASKDILVLGDSRIVQGFSAKLADEITAASGYKFINVGVASSHPRIWYYLLREIDPSAERYRAIIIPLKADNRDWRGDITDYEADLSMAGPLLRYSDAIGFALSFHHWPHRVAAFLECILRGVAFRNDLADCFAHPSERLAASREHASILDAAYRFEGRAANLTGLYYDRQTKEITYPASTGQNARTLVWHNTRLLERGIEPTEIPARWSKRIVNRYRRSTSTLILFRLPRGPLASMLDPLGDRNLVPTLTIKGQNVIVLDQYMFADIEQPEFFYDGYHASAKGRDVITRRLVGAVVEHLQPDVTESNAH